MKQFYLFVKKEFRHILRDARTVLILLLMPVVQIVLFGFAITNEVKEVKVLTLSNRENLISSSIDQRILASDYFIPTVKQANRSNADSLMKSNELQLIVEYSRDFDESVIKEGRGEIFLTADGSDPNQASSILFFASAIIEKSLREINPIESEENQLINLSTELLYNPQMKSSFNFVPGVMGLVLMIICAMMTSISIVREKETGTMEILLVSPIKPLSIILAKTIPYLLLSVINLGTILFLSYFLLEVPIGANLFSLLLLSTLFIFVSLSLGLLISSITASQVAAILISGLALLMPAMLLSGMIFPISNMPYSLQLFTKFVPATWYIEAVKKLMIQGLSIKWIWRESLALITMLIGFLSLSLLKFKYRIE